jgi:hypothetical protein
MAGFNLQTFAGSATFAQANVASGGASVNSIDFSSAGSTITMTQSSGIRVMSGQQNLFQYQGTNSGTITHAAISQNTGFYRPSGASGTLTITNAYSHLINALDDYGAGFTFTNRWGIYQAGASDNNYFASKVLIGSTTDIGVSKLQVTGNGNFTGSVSATGLFGYILRGRSSDNFGAFGFYSNDGLTRYGYIQSGSTNGGQLNITADGGSQLIMDSRGNIFNNGKVGIATGATAPSSFLQIKGGSGNQLTLDNSGERFTQVSFLNNSSSSKGAIWFDNTNSLFELYCGSGISQTFYANGSEAARISNAQNFLIGTSIDLGYKALISGNTNIVGSLYLNQVEFAASDGAANYIKTGTQLYFQSTTATIATLSNLGALTLQSSLTINGFFRVNGQSSATAGGSSGQHLIINLDGTTYKIALLNP